MGDDDEPASCVRGDVGTVWVVPRRPAIVAARADQCSFHGIDATVSACCDSGGTAIAVGAVSPLRREDSGGCLDSDDRRLAEKTVISYDAHLRRARPLSSEAQDVRAREFEHLSELSGAGWREREVD